MKKKNELVDELVKEISRLSDKKKKFESELQDLQPKEATIARLAAEDTLSEAASSKYAKQLVEVRDRKEALNLAIDLSNQKVAEYQEAIANLDRGPSWAEFEKETRLKLEVMQEGIGLAGLKGQLDDLLATLHTPGIWQSNADAPAKMQKFENGAVNVSRGLYQAWLALEETLNYAHPERMHSYPPSVGVPGFGKVL